MVLKRKKKREYTKDLKIEKGVFDKRTMLILHDLLNKGIIDRIESAIKEGKEAVILHGLKGKRHLAVKVYRIEGDFKTMWRYLVGDPRFLSVKKSRSFIVNLWCQREYKNLRTAFEGKVACPKPVAFKQNVLIMEFIGRENIPAPMLIDIKPENPRKVYDQVLDEMKKLAKTGLIHGDLSAYNILFLDKAYFIDFSHGTTTKNTLAPELLDRDIKNINSYFSKLNVNIKDAEIIRKELLEIMGRKGE